MLASHIALNTSFSIANKIPLPHVSSGAAHLTVQKSWIKCVTKKNPFNVHSILSSLCCHYPFSLLQKPRLTSWRVKTLPKAVQQAGVTNEYKDPSHRCSAHLQAGGPGLASSGPLEEPSRDRRAELRCSLALGELPCRFPPTPALFQPHT